MEREIETEEKKEKIIRDFERKKERKKNEKIQNKITKGKSNKMLAHFLTKEHVPLKNTPICKARRKLLNDEMYQEK